MQISVTTVVPDFRQRLGQIQIKFMGGRKLASIVAIAAVVTKIGQLDKMTVREGTFTMQRWKNRTIARARAAGIADFSLTAGVLNQIS